MTAAERLRDLADGPGDQAEHGLRRDIRDLLTKLEEADLERAKLLVERDIRKGRRLLDGTLVAVGQRVVLDRAAFARAGLAHGWDDKVHEITSLLHTDWGLVECGPTQIAAGHMRLATAGAEVTCASCAGWRLQMARMRADAEAYRSRQVDAFANAARKFVPKSKWDEFDAEWTRMLHPPAEPEPEAWFHAGDRGAETWTSAGSSRAEAIANGTTYYEGQTFLIAQGHRPHVTSLAAPSPSFEWERALEEAELHEGAIEALTDAITKEDEQRFRVFWREWAEGICGRCDKVCVDTDKAEEVRP